VIQLTSSKNRHPGQVHKGLDGQIRNFVPLTSRVHESRLLNREYNISILSL
jgi:hypothetical protein